MFESRVLGVQGFGGLEFPIPQSLGSVGGTIRTNIGEPAAPEPGLLSGIGGYRRVGNLKMYGG